jgi:hypothetical protein
MVLHHWADTITVGPYMYHNENNRSRFIPSLIE